MEFLKKVATYIAFITVLFVVAAYSIPKLETSGKSVTDTGVSSVTNVTSAVAN